MKELILVLGLHEKMDLNERVRKNVVWLHTHQDMVQ